MPSPCLRTPRNLVSLFSSLALLSACSSWPKAPALNSRMTPPTLSPIAPILRDWTIRGHVELSRAEKRHRASFYWQQQDHAMELRIFGPMGVGGILIRGRPGHYVLVGGPKHQKPQKATTPEALMQQALGWSLPLQPLAHFVRTLPQKSDLKQTRFSGWTAQFPTQMQIQGLRLPKDLILSHGPDFKAKVHIGEWEMDSPSGH